MEKADNATTSQNDENSRDRGNLRLVENDDFEDTMSEERRDREESMHEADDGYDRERFLAHAICEGISDVMSKVKNSVDQLQENFTSFQRQMLMSQANFAVPNSNVNHPTSFSHIGLNAGVTIPPLNVGPPPLLDYASGDRGSPQNQNNSQNKHESNSEGQSLGKMKPQQYDGSEDLNEYLTHFDIVAKLNGWTKSAKSLHLAGSLTGGARALLNDLDPGVREDFDKLVDALTNRYGTVNRAEVFKTQLQTRIKRKDETIPELAQAIQTLAKKAYPTANASMIDVLAIDHFIDALPQSDIRLRLKESRPKNLMEAEKLAVTLEAFRLADKQREKNLRVIEGKVEDQPQEPANSIENRLKQLEQELMAVKPRNNYYGNNNRGRGGFYNQRGGQSYQRARNGQDVRPSHTPQRQGNNQLSRQGAAARQ